MANRIRTGEWEKYRKRNPEKYLALRLKQRLDRRGINQKEFENMLNLQGGKCAICGTNTFIGAGKTPHIDHCHKTGKVRGLLCQKCNLGLGSFKDSEDIILKAVEYLKIFNKEQAHAN